MVPIVNRIREVKHVDLLPKISAKAAMSGCTTAFASRYETTIQKASMAFASNASATVGKDVVRMVVSRDTTNTTVVWPAMMSHTWLLGFHSVCDGAGVLCSSAEFDDGVVCSSARLSAIKWSLENGGRHSMSSKIVFDTFE